MNDKPKNEIVVLVTGLFPDAATVDAALHTLSNGTQHVRHDLQAPSMDDQAWDRVLNDVMSANTIVTL